MNPDPLSTNDKPMQYRDAVIVATVLTVLFVGTMFLPSHDYDIMVEDPQRYTYDLFTFVLQAWITSFCTLTGLTIYAKTKQTPPS